MLLFLNRVHYSICNNQELDARIRAEAVAEEEEVRQLVTKRVLQQYGEQLEVEVCSPASRHNLSFF
jgi:hypothetical protein